MAREKLFCWPVPKTCLVIAVISLVGWLTVTFICLSYSALDDEQGSEETFLELFDTTVRNKRILFFTVDQLSFYVTIKLAFTLALMMVFASGSIIVAIAWRIKYVCLVYPTLAAVSGLAQIIVILCFTSHLPVPVFWYVGEVLISMCTLLLYRYYDRPEAPWKIAPDESNGVEIDEATSVSVNSIVDEEVQVEGKEPHHHHHHHPHHHHHHKKDPAVARSHAIDVNENAVDGINQ